MLGVGVLGLQIRSDDLHFQTQDQFFRLPPQSVDPAQTAWSGRRQVQRLQDLQSLIVGHLAVTNAVNVANPQRFAKSAN